uniref:Uncharacterized protein n=1 Tax=Rhizophagus irregularis (strain DAOM 181602 / DAOM 197198 / MUCL 43194) TaxID=747089 RepID=U9U2J0_RHIID
MAQQKSGTAYQTIFPVITQKKLSNQFLVYRKLFREQNNVMLGLALNGLGFAYSLPL